MNLLEKCWTHKLNLLLLCDSVVGMGSHAHLMKRLGVRRSIKYRYTNTPADRETKSKLVILLHSQFLVLFYPHVASVLLGCVCGLRVVAIQFPERA